MNIKFRAVRSLSAFLILSILMFIYSIRWVYETNKTSHTRVYLKKEGTNRQDIRFLQEGIDGSQNMRFDKRVHTFANETSELQYVNAIESHDSTDTNGDNITIDTYVSNGENLQNRTEISKDKFTITRGLQQSNLMDDTVNNVKDYIHNKSTTNKKNVTVYKTDYKKKFAESRNISTEKWTNNIYKHHPKLFSSQTVHSNTGLLNMTLNKPKIDVLKLPLEVPQANLLSIQSENSENKSSHKIPVLDGHKTDIYSLQGPGSKFKSDLVFDTIIKSDNAGGERKSNVTSVDRNKQVDVVEMHGIPESDEGNIDRNDSNKIKIGILIPSSTRNVLNPSLSNLSLVNISIPSLYDTFERKYLYRIYIGIDKGDRLERLQDELKKRFDCVIIVIVNGKTFVKSVNTIAERAYNDGMDYLIRTNDDTKLVSADWTSLAINKLKEYIPHNIGVVGPTCKEGNSLILTHDMVHRTHLEIFNFYYPPYLENWWADDWITRVYELHRSTKLKSWLVKHYVGQMRYNVDSEKEKWFKTLLEYDKIRLQNYLGYSCPYNAASKLDFVPGILTCVLIFIVCVIAKDIKLY